LYAIGEIILVVFGILIALRINNWNEYRKERIAKKEILIEIKNDLAETMNDLESDLNYRIAMLKSANFMLTSLLNDYVYHDSIAYHLSLCFGDTKTYYKKVDIRTCFQIA
jgi:hypothetical protein